MISALPPYRLIETPGDLENLGVRLNQETSVALDLEGDSLYHYREKICLIQIAAGYRMFSCRSFKNFGPFPFGAMP